MRKQIAVTVLTALLGLGGFGVTSAFADPAFGPGAGEGQGNDEPHENPGTRCHPPGQTSDRSECK